ncbi:MAG: hypothetical protein CM15mP49_08710 [Actinomycetota bacterium]|nr:MAG: hypothetical protein CM15mP49_08710 [Actinomycetota bacterium]
MHSGNYAFRDRRAQRGNFANFGLKRINAACRETEQHTADSLTVLKFPESVDRKICRPCGK